jgi:hypothetical protein
MDSLEDLRGVDRGQAVNYLGCVSCGGWFRESLNRLLEVFVQENTLVIHHLVQIVAAVRKDVML